MKKNDEIFNSLLLLLSVTCSKARTLKTMFIQIFLFFCSSYECSFSFTYFPRCSLLLQLSSCSLATLHKLCILFCFICVLHVKPNRKNKEPQPLLAKKLNEKYKKKTLQQPNQLQKKDIFLKELFFLLFYFYSHLFLWKFQYK